jgi:hypothetical protein
MAFDYATNVADEIRFVLGCVPPLRSVGVEVKQQRRIVGPVVRESAPSICV